MLRTSAVQAFTPAMEISIKHKGEILQEIKQGRVYSLTPLLKTHYVCFIILHRIWSYFIKWCLYFPLHAHKVCHYSCPWRRIKLLISIFLSLTTTHTHTHSSHECKETHFHFQGFSTQLISSDNENMYFSLHTVSCCPMRPAAINIFMWHFFFSPLLPPSLMFQSESFASVLCQC